MKRAMVLELSILMMSGCILVMSGCAAKLGQEDEQESQDAGRNRASDSAAGEGRDLGDAATAMHPLEPALDQASTPAVEAIDSGLPATPQLSFLDDGGVVESDADADADTPLPPTVRLEEVAQDAGTFPDAAPPADGGLLPNDDAGSPSEAVHSPGDSECESEFRAGHGDLFLSYGSVGGLVLGLRSHLEYPEPEGLPPLVSPEGVCIVVPSSSYAESVALGGRPEREEFVPVGVEAGVGFWFLSQNNMGAAQPFLGVATEGVDPTLVEGLLSFEFVDVQGPVGSQVSVYQATFPPRFYLSTSHPDATVGSSPIIEMAAAGHDHYNWTFSRAGRYDVTLVASGVVGGRMQESEARTYHFLVTE